MILGYQMGLICRITTKIIILIKQKKMSTSLPRIRTLSQLPQQPSQPSLKFKKLNLESENGEEQKKTLKTLKTERLKNLSRYSTVQQQRQYKNQKIHLNLIERKLLNGTYDEKKETGNQLNVLKQKRDHIKVETILKQRENERLKTLLRDVKQEIAQLTVVKDETQRRLDQAKQKYDTQLLKTQGIKQYQAVLQNMVSTRKVPIILSQSHNIQLTKRTNDLKKYLSHITSTMNIVDSQLRQISQKVANRESKLIEWVEKSLKDRNQRNQHIYKHQEKIGKRKEDQLLQYQRSKHYMAQLDQMEQHNELKEFHTTYDKILGNFMLSKLCESQMLSLHSKYEIYEYSFRKLCSYRSFDPEEPATLVERFIEHEHEKRQREERVKDLQKHIEILEEKNDKLKEDLITAQSQMLQNEQQLSRSTSQLSADSHALKIASLQEEIKQAEKSTIKIRSYILQMLNKLNQKGQKRLGKDDETTVRNINLLKSICLQLAQLNN